MNINWVMASTYDPGMGFDVGQFKNIGPIWSSYKAWRACVSDNVICHDSQQTQELLRREFQKVCNFYIPVQHFMDLGRPTGVKLYEGDYLQDTRDLEDVIALHLAASVSDIVLMMGFDFSKPEPIEDRLENHRVRNRLGLIRKVILDNQQVQWALIDHFKEPDEAWLSLPNLTRDNMHSVIQLLGPEQQ